MNGQRDGATEACRRASIHLREALSCIAAERVPEAVRPFGGYIESANRVLESVENSSEGFLFHRIDEAVTRLRHVLHAMQEPTELVPVLRKATESIARSLVVLHPVHKKLETEFQSQPPPPIGGEEPTDPDPGADERRAHERVPVRTAIGFQSSTRFFTGFSGDLSDGGLFVASEHLLAVGTRLTLSLVLPSGEQMTAEGEVSWTRPVSGPEGLRGMGIAFRDVAENSAEAVVAFVEQQEPAG